MASRRDFFRFMLGGAAAVAGLPKTARPENTKTVLPFPAKTNPDFWNELRKQFPQPTNEVFFNNGTIGPMPSPVVRRVVESMEDLNKTMGRRAGYGPEIEIRKQIARIINCSAEEISLTQNSHMAMNKISMGLDLQPGDEIVQTDQEHPGGECGWLVCGKRYGVVQKKVKIPIPPNNPKEIIQRFAEAITHSTKVLAIPHITSTLGLLLPVKEIVQMYRAKGIFTVLDGAQAVGQVKVDVKDIDCDAYFTSLHKWLLAPAGNGCLFVKRGSAEKIWTVLAGSQWNNQDDPGYRLQEHGFCSRPLLLGLSAAVDFFQDVGPDRWIGRIKELGDRLRKGLQSIPGVKIYSSVHPAMSTGMTTYKVGSWDGIKMYDHFLAKKAMRMRRAPNGGTRAGAYGVRQSVHIYHNETEIDRALEAVREIA